MTAAQSLSRFAMSLLLTVLLLTGSAAGFIAPAVAEPEPEPEEAVSVSLKVLNITPTTVGPEDELTVEIELTNSTLEAVESVDVAMSVVRYKLSTNSILDNWFLGNESLVTPVKLDSVSLEEPLQPGATQKVTLQSPASELRLLPFADAAGPRGLILTASDSSTGQQLDLVRTFLLWYPTDDVEPLRLTILSPITGPAATPANPKRWGQEIAHVTGPDGRLNALLQFSALDRDITWVVDPALVQAASAGTAGDNGTNWAASFSQHAKGRDVFGLAPFDPDFAALAAADVTLSKVDLGFSPATAWRDDLTLPATDAIDQKTLRAAVAEDRSIVVMEQGLQPLATDPAVSNATATVPTAAGPATALLPNAELSELFTNPSVAGLRSTFESRQLLLARLAIIAQDNPLASQHVLLTTDREWHPNIADLKIMLDGISDAQFIEVEPLSRLLGGRIARDLPVSIPAEAETSPFQVTARELSGLLDQQQQLETLAQAVVNPQFLTTEFRSSFAAITSSAWRNDSTGRRGAIKELSQYTSGVLSAVSIVPGSDLNLISDRGDLPVTVKNELDYDLNINVALIPDDQRLSITETVAVTIPAQSSASVHVPATAIGSGNVSVEVRVLSPDGDLIALPSQFTVRVRADWENVGTAVLAGILAIALIFGVFRTIKRGKRSTRMDPIYPPSTPESSS